MKITDLDLSVVNNAICIAIIGSKGGVGKTTLAVNIAALLANTTFKDGDSRRKARVLVVDMDSQRSTSFWYGERQFQIENGYELSQIDCFEALGKGAPGMIRAAMPNYDFIIMDTGGKNTMELPAALSVSHFAILSTLAHAFDEQTYEKIDEYIAQLSIPNPALVCFAFANKLKPHAKHRLASSREAFEMFENIYFTDCHLGDYEVMASSTETGFGIMELPSGSSLSKAKGQLSVLLDELFDSYFATEEDSHAEAV